MSRPCRRRRGCLARCTALRSLRVHTLHSPESALPPGALVGLGSLERLEVIQRWCAPLCIAGREALSPFTALGSMARFPACVSRLERLREECIATRGLQVPAAPATAASGSSAESSDDQLLDLHKRPPLPRGSLRRRLFDWALSVSLICESQHLPKEECARAVRGCLVLRE